MLWGRLRERVEGLRPGREAALTSQGRGFRGPEGGDFHLLEGEAGCSEWEA